jgi:pimeloyl-ACP methyl ester carboxylesterase
MTAAPAREGRVEADGVTIPYVEAGQGTPVVHVQSGAGPRLTPAHELLARQYRVIAFGEPPADATRSRPELASTLAVAISKLGVDTFNLVGSAAGATVALWLALQARERVLALVLEAPAAIRQGEDGNDLESRLEELPTPTLVLFGTRDTVVAPDMTRVYKERIPSCHLVFVYDAGHAIAVDRPEAFSEVVGDFLERHEAFVISRTATVINP